MDAALGLGVDVWWVGVLVRVGARRSGPGRFISVGYARPGDGASRLSVVDLLAVRYARLHPRLLAARVVSAKCGGGGSTIAMPRWRRFRGIYGSALRVVGYAVIAVEDGSVPYGS